jgi:ATP-dependent helicase/nuclease subunit A
MEAQTMQSPQKIAIYSTNPFVVVSAGAGSGKTKVLTERFIHICEQKLEEQLGGLGKATPSHFSAEAEQIVAITFTKKAAREMKDRIYQQIEKKIMGVLKIYLDPFQQEVAYDYWKKQRDQLSMAVITTFHSFCSTILRDHAIEAGVSPNFKVIEEVEAVILQHQLLDDLFDEEPILEKWPLLFENYKVSSLKNSVMRIYSKFFETETKTDLESFFNPAKILAIWTEKQEKIRPKLLERKQSNLERTYSEMESYVQGTDTSGRKSKFKEIVKELKGLFQMEEQLDKYQQFEEILEKMDKRSISDDGFKQLLVNWKAEHDLIVEELEKLRIVSPKEEGLVVQFSELLIEFYKRYERKKQELKGLDFSDLQQKALHLLKNEVIKTSIQAKYRHFMIDEFQDSNRLQLELIETIQPAYRFIVGDAKQSIYLFRGADVSVMKEVIEQAKGLGSYIEMNRNYRSSAGILTFINAIFEEMMVETESKFSTSYQTIEIDRDSAKDNQVRVEWIQVGDKAELDTAEEQSEDVPKQQGQKQSEASPNEYHFIAQRMKQFMKEKTEIFDKVTKTWRPVDWGDMAILLKSRTNLSKIEYFLKKNHIPYNIYGGIGFYERQEVRDVLLILNWLNRPWEDIHILALLRSPMFGLTFEQMVQVKTNVTTSLFQFMYAGDFSSPNLDQSMVPRLKRFSQLYQRWLPFTFSKGIQHTLQELLEDVGLYNLVMLQPNSLQMLSNIEKVIGIIAGLNTNSLERILSHLEKLIAFTPKEGDAAAEISDTAAVSIMTIHASKGLEFPIVFVPDIAKTFTGESGKIRYHQNYRLVLQHLEDPKPTGSYTEVSGPFFDDVVEDVKLQLQEERKRLLYVAMTRAQDYLILSSTKEKQGQWYKDLIKILQEKKEIGDLLEVTYEVSDCDSKLLRPSFVQMPSVRVKRELPVSLSVTEIVDYIESPKKYFEKYIQKRDKLFWKPNLSSQPKKAKSMDSATLGTLVHRVIELVDQGLKIDHVLDIALTTVEVEDALREEYKAEGLALVQNYQLAELGEPIENEWSFCMELEGAEIIGEIDKITKKNGDYFIIDLKTNKEETIDHYIPQLYLYKLAYEKINPVSGCTLFFLRNGVNGLHPIRFEEDLDGQVREAVRELIELKNGN